MIGVEMDKAETIIKPITIIRVNGGCRGFKIERREKHSTRLGKVKLDNQGEKPLRMRKN